jgi:hypothetical protein
MVTSGLRVALPVLWSVALANGVVCSLVYRAVWQAGGR